VRDGDNLTFIIISQKLSGTGEYHVARSYDDFDWLQQHLFCQEEVPGIQGIIFPPLPAKAQVNASAKVVKQLGILALGDWKPYGAALERFLQQVASHSVLSKNKAVEDFLTSSEVSRHTCSHILFKVYVYQPGKHQHTGASDLGGVKGTLIYSEVTKLKHVDVFQKHMGSVAENNMNTLGLGLDLEARYQEEMLFRRTCKLVELETAKRNAEKAKPVKKPLMEEVKKTTEAEFSQISAMAKQEVNAQLQKGCFSHFEHTFTLIGYIYVLEL
uniref:PX domain-containing protein n=1 Tax=Periophthalmus magnuspinnatus TaxID=409849 RepID=A0A3B4A8I3_9GOBI